MIKKFVGIRSNISAARESVEFPHQLFRVDL